MDIVKKALSILCILAVLVTGCQNTGNKDIQLKEKAYENDLERDSVPTSYHFDNGIKEDDQYIVECPETYFDEGESRYKFDIGIDHESKNPKTGEETTTLYLYIHNLCGYVVEICPEEIKLYVNGNLVAPVTQDLTVFEVMSSHEEEKLIEYNFVHGEEDIIVAYYKNKAFVLDGVEYFKTLFNKNYTGEYNQGKASESNMTITQSGDSYLVEGVLVDGKKFSGTATEMGSHLSMEGVTEDGGEFQALLGPHNSLSEYWFVIKEMSWNEYAQEMVYLYNKTKDGIKQDFEKEKKTITEEIEQQEPTEVLTENVQSPTENTEEELNQGMDESAEIQDSSARYSDEELCKMAQQYYYNKTGFEPPISEVDHEEGNGVISIHLYEIMDAGTEYEHWATSDWYRIDRVTAKGVDSMGDEIDLTEVSE